MKAVPGQAVNPYVGLRPFEAEDSLFFFGRDEQIREFLPRLEASRLLAVVGGSGCGKSSLVRAGLIPLLQAGFLVEERDAWLIATMRPGDRARRRLCDTLLRLEDTDPSETDRAELDDRVQNRGVEALIERLQPILKGRSANLLLLVDQFEELFHADRREGLVKPSDESRQFVQLLLDLASASETPVYVILTVRSDFLGDCALFEGLPEAMNRSQYLVPRLDFRQRRRAIAGPAELCGVSVSPTLLDRLSSEQLDTLDDLPVLQHALRRTWAHWRKRGGKGELGVEDYVAIGTVHEALNRDAEEAFLSIPEDRRENARRFFQALSMRDASNRRVRRPTRLSVLSAITGASSSELLEIAAPFTTVDRSFLTISAEEDPLIDISHESLIRQWQRLQGWVDEEAESAGTYRRLVDAALRYRAGLASLYRSVDLAIAARWRQQHSPNEAWARRYEVLPQSGGSHYAEALEFLAASERARRRNWILAVAGVATVVTVLSVLTGYAFWQRQQAIDREAEKQSALQREIVSRRDADSNAVRAELALEMETKASTSNALLAAQLSRLARDLQSTNQLLLSSYSNLRKLQGELTANVEDLIRARSRAESNAVQAQFAERARAEALFESHLGSATSLGQSETFAAALSELEQSETLDTNARPERISTRNLLRWYANLLHRGAVWTNAEVGTALRCIATTADGRWTIVGGEEGKVALVDSRARRVLHVWGAHQGTVRAVVVDSPGRRFFTAGEDNRVLIWSIPGTSAATFLEKPDAERRLPAAVVALGIDPQARWLAIGTRDGVVEIQSAQSANNSPNPRRRLPGDIPSITSLAFSSDGSQLVAASAQGLALLWKIPPADRDLSQIAAPRTLFQIEASVREIVFDRKDRRIASGCADGTIQIWDPVEGLLLRPLPGHRSAVGSLAFASLNGRDVLISGGADRVLKVWDLESGRAPMLLEGHAAGITGITTPGDTSCVSVSNDGTLREWSFNSTAAARRLTQVPPNPVSCALTPDASGIAVGSQRGELWMVDPGSGNVRWKQTNAHGGAVTRLAVSRSGRWIASGGEDGRVRFWNSDTGTSGTLEFPRLSGSISALAFAPDETTLAVAAGGTETHLHFEGGLAEVERSPFSGQLALLALNGGEHHVVRAHRGAALYAGFDQSGRHLISAGTDGRLLAWDISHFPGTSRILWTNSWGITWAAVQNDRSNLVIAGRDGVVSIVAPDFAGTSEPAGKWVASLAGHENTIVRVELSPDGAHALSLATDGTLRGWDLSASTPRSLFTLELPVTRADAVGLRDFSFVPWAVQGDAWLAIPVSRRDSRSDSAVIVYPLGRIYPSDPATATASLVHRKF